MTDEAPELAPNEPDIPAIGGDVAEAADLPQVSDEPTDDNAPDLEETTGAESEDEYEEIEHNGKRYQVHKDLRDGFLMQADYTRKTQSAAELKKELDAREQRIAEQAKVTEDDLNDRATTQAIKARLKEYENVDWLALNDRDPVEKGKHETIVRMLEKELAMAEKRIADRQTARAQESQQATAKRFEETEAFAAKEIPGWSNELGAKVLETAQQLGVPTDFLRDNMSPTMLKILHRAYVGEQALRKQTAAAKAPSPAIQPLAKVGTKANPAPRLNNLATDDVEAYAAARKRGTGGKHFLS